MYEVERYEGKGVSCGRNNAVFKLTNAAVSLVREERGLRGNSAFWRNPQGKAPDCVEKRLVIFLP